MSGGDSSGGCGGGGEAVAGGGGVGEGAAKPVAARFADRAAGLGSSTFQGVTDFFRGLVGGAGADSFAKPGAAGATPKPAASPGRWMRLAARAWGWANRLPKPAAGAIPAFRKPAVQAELSLDHIKVVRNDLSDADLEVVPGRSETPAAGVDEAKAKPGPAAAKTKPMLQPVASWNRMSARLRMSTRLFGTGKS